MAERVQLTIFGRPACHLCEEMAQQLEVLAKELEIHICHVDIDDNPTLADKLNDLVPLLMHDDRELSRYRLNLPALRAYLAEIR